MVSADERMPVRGKGRGKAEPSGKKPEKRARKSRQKADQPLVEAQEQTDAPVASVESSPAETAMIDVAPVAAAESSPAETVVIDVAPLAPAESRPVETAAVDAAPVATAPVDPVVPTQPAHAPDPVSYQAITNAYGDFTRKSIEQTSSFFEQLAGARSFNRAFQLQTEYAQKAYETFVAESEKIRELHCELNRQRLQRFESLVTGTKATRSS
jgi:Phasin protein